MSELQQKQQTLQNAIKHFFLFLLQLTIMVGNSEHDSLDIVVQTAWLPLMKGVESMLSPWIPCV